ncbi:hypothetical protein KQI96_16780, partial [Enterococcus sp. S163_ASV_20]|nr:hypothetical protein [Enterococcus sp. S163_ASV_20]
GNSANVVAAAEEARRLGAKVVALTGGSGGRLAGHCDVLLNVSAGQNSGRVQESHGFAIHAMIDIMERVLSLG